MCGWGEIDYWNWIARSSSWIIVFVLFYPNHFIIKFSFLWVQVFWDLCFLPCLVILIYHIQHYPRKSYLFDPNKILKSYEHYNLYQKKSNTIWQDMTKPEFRNKFAELKMKPCFHALVNLFNVQSLRQN